MLAKRLTSFRTFKTMVTPSADVLAPSRFTPLMQAYWVRALRVRVMICFGIPETGRGRRGVRSIGKSLGRAEVLLDGVLSKGLL